MIVAGGGVAGLEAVLALGALAGSRFDVVLLSASPRFLYAPFSVVEPFGFGRAYQFELKELLAGSGVETIIGRMEAVDAEARCLRTSGGAELEYDACLIAIGAGRHGALPGAITFAGPKASAELRTLLQDVAAGRIERLAYAVPPGVAWSLPAYELALMTAARFEGDTVGPEVALVTPEPRPLDVFGEGPSAAVADLLRARRVAFHPATPARAEPGRLTLKDGGEVQADAVVALPEVVPHEIAGLPRDERGFLPVDEHCRVPGAARLYGAGDGTGSMLKQGGIATQQADTAAAAIAADLGAGPEPAPLSPVLHALLVTGPAPRYRRVEAGRPGPLRPEPSTDAGAGKPLTKIAGRRLGQFLALQGVPPGAPPGTFAIELDT